MGIEEDAIGLFIGTIFIVLASEFLVGMFLLSGKSKQVKRCLYGNIAFMMAAYFFLFNCYFHTADGISNMTFGIGLFILAWAASVAFMVRMIDLLYKNNKEPGSDD